MTNRIEELPGHRSAHAALARSRRPANGLTEQELARAVTARRERRRPAPLGAWERIRAATVRERFPRNLLKRGSRARGSELRQGEDGRSKAFPRRDARVVRRSCGQAATELPGVRWRSGPPIDRSGRNRGRPTARALACGWSSPAPSRAHGGTARGTPRDLELDHPRRTRRRRPRSARPAGRNRPAVRNSR